MRAISRTVRGRWWAAAAVGLVLTTTAGCGSAGTAAPADTGSSPSASASATASSTGSSSPAPVGWPRCDAVWKTGATLASSYAGCRGATGAVAAQKLSCSSGQTFVLYADHYFATRGGTVRHTARVLKNSPVYASAIAVCRG